MSSQKATSEASMDTGAQPVAADAGGSQQEAAPAGSARGVRRSLLSDDYIDQLVDQATSDGLSLTGKDGFLPELIRSVLERGLHTELSDHLGYEKGDVAGQGAPNSRNGSTGKTLDTEAGPVDLDTPRD